MISMTEDEPLSLASFQLAAEQNLDAAQVQIGKSLYQNGQCPLHYAEALRWFQLAATQGDPDALFLVGYMHELGHGMPADNVTAIRWYKRAAAAGQLRAAHCLQKFGVSLLGV
jgi:TPR repeat protein